MSARPNRIGQAIRDRWLKISVGKGYYVPGKGAQNMYHGICPPELVEQLREGKRKGWSVVQDKELSKAANAAAERINSGVEPDHPETNHGVTSDHPEQKSGVTGNHPAPDRGDPGAGSGWRQATRTQIYSDDEEKDDDENARARDDNCADETLIARCGSAAGLPMVAPITRRADSAADRA